MFVPGNPFQPSRIFERKAVVCSSKTPIWKALNLIYEHQTRLELLPGYKHSSLLLTVVNYGCKKFYKIDSRTENERKSKES